MASGSETRRLPRQVSIRVAPDLYDALVVDAKANGRTVAQTVRFHLRRQLHVAPPVNSGSPE